MNGKIIVLQTVLILSCGLLCAAEDEFSELRADGVVLAEQIGPAGDAEKLRASLEILLPPVIAAGMDMYAIEGAESAVKTWVKGGPLEGDAKVLSSVQAFNEVEKFYGKYEGSHLVSQRNLTPSSKLIYIQMNYEKGPLFVRFLCFLSGGKWVVAGRMVLNTEPDEVLRS